MSFCKVEVKEEVDEEETEQETEKVYVKVGGVKILVGEGTTCKLPQRQEKKRARQPAARMRGLRAEEETPEARKERLRRQNELKRKSLARETPEKRAERLRKTKEVRRRQLETETPEERAARLEKEAERRRRRQGLEKPKTEAEKEKRQMRRRENRRTETPEEAAERRRKRAEAMRRRREEERRLLEKVPETEEEKKKREELEEKRRQTKFNDLVKRATMTEEEKEAKRMNRYFYKQAYVARGGGWKNLPESVKEKKKKQWREWLKNLEGEGKERYKESMKRAQKKYFERVKVEGTKNGGCASDWHKKYMERVRREEPDKWNKWKERAKEYQRRRYATETPEERERRKWKEKVNAARRRLKKQLEEEGMQVEEIGRRDEELKVQMWREFDPDMDVTQKNPPGRKPREGAASVPTQVTALEDIGRRERNNQQDLSPPIHHIVPPASYSLSSTSLQNKEIQTCTAPGGINDNVIKGDEDHFSPPPSPDFPPSPSHSESECQETTDPQSCHPSNFTKDVSPPPVRSRDTVQCSHCPLEFPTESQLRSHIIGCHPSKCWKCPKCQEVVLSPFELSQHYSTAHKVSKEGAPPPSPPKKEVYKFTCISCSNDSSHGNQFKTRLELFAHVKLKHRKSFWPCDHCNLLKYSQKSLDLHLQICRRHNNDGGIVEVRG